MAVSFTDRELDVVAILWARGPSTVAEVRDALEDTLAYTTVLTVLRTLEDKGHVGHTAEGRAYRYFPLVEREAAGRSALRQMVRKLFAGSPELLLTQLVSERGMSADELRRMRELLDERLAEGVAHRTREAGGRARRRRTPRGPGNAGHGRETP